MTKPPLRSVGMSLQGLALPRLLIRDDLSAVPPPTTWQSLPRVVRKIVEQKLTAIAHEYGVVGGPDIVSVAVASYTRFAFKFDIGYLKPANEFEQKLINIVREALVNYQPQSEAAKTKPARKKQASSIRTKDDSLALQYSDIVISVLEQIIHYDLKRRHNEPPPLLWIADDAYLLEVRRLLTEVKKVRGLLAKGTSKPARRRAAVDTHAHVDRFLSKFAGSIGTALGTGLAALLVGNIAAMLYQLGLDGGMVARLLSHINPPK